jgi:O-antigen/teichoic acid export membrane protein
VTEATWTETAPVAAPKASRLGRNLTALAGGQLVTWTMTFLWTLIVPRALGPSGTGLIVSAMAVAGVLGVVLGLGTRNYLVREMVVDPDAAPRLLGTAVVMRVLLTPVFVAAVVVYAHFAHYGHRGTVVLYLAAGATLLTLFAEPLQAGFQAIERMEYLALSDVITKSGQGVLGIALVLIGFRAVGIAGSMAAVAALVVVLNAAWLSRWLRVDLRTNAAHLRDMVRQSVAYWAFGLFFMFYLWIDSVLLSLLTRSEVVGWYGVPTRLFQTLMFLPALLSTAWLPRLVSAFGEGPERLRDAARTPLELVGLLGPPICAGTVVVAGPMIHALYGSAYDRAVPVLIVLGLCVPPMYLNIVLNNVLVAAKRQVLWTYVMAGATVVNPLINVALIPFTEHRYGNGAIGAAVSLLLTELVILVAGFVIVGRSILDRATVQRPLLATVASVVSWAAAHVVHPFGAIASLGAAGVTFVLLAAAFGLARPDEIAAARSTLARVFRRKS